MQLIYSNYLLFFLTWLQPISTPRDSRNQALIESNESSLADRQHAVTSVQAPRQNIVGEIGMYNTRLWRS